MNPRNSIPFVLLLMVASAFAACGGQQVAQIPVLSADKALLGQRLPAALFMLEQAYIGLGSADIRDQYRFHGDFLPRKSKCLCKD